MFTGIIEKTGVVQATTKNTLAIEVDFAEELALGDSIAVNGACLTVVSKEANRFTVDFMPETAKKTTIGFLSKGDVVNLERAMQASSRFDGHMVSGHVEGLGDIKVITEEDNAKVITIEVPESLEKYIVDTGSITINGISLTVIAVEERKIKVSIIPHTWENTNLQHLTVGDRVNIETDLIAKYIEKLTK